MGSSKIGIDLGTNFARICAFKNNRVDAIPNERGHTQTPTYVAFTKTHHLVGESAKKQVNVNPANTIFNINDLLGKRCEDTVLEETKTVYEISTNRSGKS